MGSATRPARREAAPGADMLDPRGPALYRWNNPFRLARSVPMTLQTLRLSERKAPRFDDEVRFIRTWLEKPLATGAVTPSGRILARTMARYVEPEVAGPVVELGPGTGPVTEALVEHGVDPARLILVEFNPRFCALLRVRFPTATVLQGDAYRLRAMLAGLLRQPLAARVTGR